MYASSEGGPKFDDRVAVMQLPLPLPDLFVSTDGVPSGVRAASIDVDSDVATLSGHRIARRSHAAERRSAPDRSFT
jgi:hypothetical protein